jgi:hypothetical protein
MYCNAKYEVIRDRWSQFKHPKYEPSWDQVRSEFFGIRTIHPSLIVFITNELKSSTSNVCPKCKRTGHMKAMAETEFDIETLCLSFASEPTTEATIPCSQCADMCEPDELWPSPMAFHSGDVCDTCYEALTITG